MEDLQDKIIELMDLFDDEVVTTADKIDRPQRALDREAIDDFMKRNPMAGGGMLVQPSADGSRPGYNGKDNKKVSPNNITKSEASFKVYEDKFGKKLLDEMAQEKYNKNFRDLDKNNQLKFFKSQLNKYEDFIKENKRYPNPTEAYNIGLTQGGKKSSILTDEVKTKIKDIYTSGEGGSTYISKKLAEEVPPINVDDSTIRRFITAEEEAGNLVRPTKFKTQEPKAPKDRYNIIRKVTNRDLKGFTVGRSGTEVLAPEGSKYKITFNIPRSTETTKIPSEYQGTQYYKTKAQADKALAGSKKFSKDLARQAKANKGLREIILEEISDPDVEREIVTMKEGTDLATAHRASYKQIKKLGELYNILNLGIEAPGINSGAIRKFENKLDNLYKEQNNLIRTARRSTNKGLEIPKNIQKRIDDVNKEISSVVDLTNQRVQGILVDAKTLKPYTYGINYIKTYGMGFLDNKPVKDITDADLKVIEDNLKFQIDREKKLGSKTESFLRDRQPLLKYTKELSEPGFINKIPAKLRPVLLGTGITIGGVSAVSAADGTETKSILPEAAAGTTAALTLGTKKGRNIAGRIIGGGFGPTGLAGLTVAGGGYDLSSPLDRFILSSEAAFAPELVKGTIGATKGMKNRALQKVVQRALNLGMSVPTALKVARVAQPLGIMGGVIEGSIAAGKNISQEANRIADIKDSDLQQLEYENLIKNIKGFAGGGRAGFKVGSLRKGIQALIDESVKKTPKDTTPELDKLIKKTLDEDFFDKKDRIIDNINAKIARARAKGLDSEEIGRSQIEFYDDILKSNFKTKTGPFFDRRKKAGGGLLKQAGVESGPPPESGPNSQGLQGLLNRVKKV